MGCEGVSSVPVVVYSGEEDGSAEWEAVRDKVREALEFHGFFLFQYVPMSMTLYEKMLMAMEELFDLPTKTKERYRNPYPYRSYTCNSPVVPLLESFGVDGAHQADSADDFTGLMWPDGNPEFSETLTSMASRMVEISGLLSKMIFQSFHVDGHLDGHVANYTSTFRMMKYNVPDGNTDSALGLVPHTDKNFLTVLSQNHVQGLEVLDSVWSQVTLPEGFFVIFAGDTLKAWSNGRVKAAEHRVTMSGDHVRYTWAIFSVPKEGMTVEVPDELVDQDHPLLYRPFDYTEFMSFFVSQEPHLQNPLEVYARVK